MIVLEQLVLAKTSVQDDPTYVKWDINHLNPTFVDGINHFSQAHLYGIFYIWSLLDITLKH